MLTGSKYISKKAILLYVLWIGFIGLGFYFFLKKETLWFFALPLVLFIAYYYLVSLDKVVLLIALVTPLAVNLQDSVIGAALSIPTEPLMFGVLILFVTSILLDGHYNKKLAQHPVSLLIYYSLFWMFITSLTSELPLVSYKHLLSRIWFVVPFYFMAAVMFREKKNIHSFVLLYLTGFIVVIIYTIVRHAGYGFDEDAGHWVMTPFYNDHTAYGAALALFLPVITGYVFYPGLLIYKRILAFLVLGLLVLATILSYSRAAWLSLIVAAVVFVFVMLRVRFKWIVLGIIVLAGTFIAFQNQIYDRMSKNKQDSSDNMMEHIQSMSNISSDASNLERINRWTSAIRLFEQRPWLGWGPGTYQFVYAPYQRASERTIISTNTGDKGNAHSEYLGPLSEEGIPGLLGVLLLFGYCVYTGLKVYRKSKGEVRFLSLMIVLGLITYMVHGFLNNFLDTDKLSVPFWGFAAILVALETYHLQNTDDKKDTEIKKPEKSGLL